MSSSESRRKAEGSRGHSTSSNTTNGSNSGRESVPTSASHARAPSKATRSGGASCANPWAVALLIVDFDESHGQVVQHVHPADAIPEHMLPDIKMLAMPDCLEAGVEHEFVFQSRVKNKRGKTPFEFINLFIYFKQSRNPASKRGFEQRSYVLVARHFYAPLAFRILTRLVDVIESVPSYEAIIGDVPASASSPVRGVVLCSPAQKAAIEVMFEHFRQWPLPVPGLHLHLPFYGEMIDFEVPEMAEYLSSPDDTFASDSYRPGDLGFGDGSGIVGNINLMSVFGPLGLVPHLWTLWDLILQGEDIVVYAPTAAICSSVVMALASLTSPLACCADIRPYINTYDSDISLIAKAADVKSLRPADEGYFNGLGSVSPSKHRSRMQASMSSSRDNLASDAAALEAAADPWYNVIEDIHVGSIQCRVEPPQMIVGVTNPFLLKSFSKFQNVIYIPGTPRPTSLLSSISSSGLTKFATKLLAIPTGQLPADQSPGATGRSMSTSGTPPQSHGARAPSRDTAASPSMSHPISPGGASNAPGSTSIARPPPPVFKQAFSATHTVLSPVNKSLEAVYDGWYEGGGAGIGRYARYAHVLLCTRRAPSILPDKAVLARLASFNTNANGSVPPGNTGLDPTSDEVLVGGLVLREHFKTLTLTLLKPFDVFFTPVDPRHEAAKQNKPVTGFEVMSIGGPLRPGSARIPAHLTSTSPQQSTRRAGASNLWLYADAATILGSPKPEDVVDHYILFTHFDSFPTPFGGSKPKLRSFMIGLFRSRHFQIWADWRRNAMISHLCMAMVETSKNLSVKDLLAAFAVEQDTEVLTLNHLKTLAGRIESLMANVRALNAFASTPVTDDSALCSHMESHLIAVNNLIAHRDADAMYAGIPDDQFV